MRQEIRKNRKKETRRDFRKKREIIREGKNERKR